MPPVVIYLPFVYGVMTANDSGAGGAVCQLCACGLSA